MPDKEYYPDYYLRKKQRDAVYRKVGWIAGAIAVILAGVVVGVLLFRNNLLPPRTEAPSRADDAAQLQELVDEDIAASIGEDNPATSDSNPAEDDLSDASQSISPADQEYTPALSNVQTRLEGNGDGSLVINDSYEEEPAAESGDDDEDPHVIPAAEEEEAPVERPVEVPEEAPEESEPVEEAAPPTGASKYIVGAGSYLQESEASSRLRDLAALNLLGHIESRGGQHTILIDKSFETYEQAEALVLQLKEYGYNGAFCARTTR